MHLLVTVLYADLYSLFLPLKDILGFEKIQEDQQKRVVRIL